MSRILADLFRWRSPRAELCADPLGEFLRGTNQSDVAPEVLLRIL